MTSHFNFICQKFWDLVLLPRDANEQPFAAVDIQLEPMTDAVMI